MEIILVLHNIRSAVNVGAILRTAEGFGIKKVVCSGYTPCEMKPGLLPHQVEHTKRMLEKTALGAEKMVRIQYFEDVVRFLKGAKARPGTRVIGLENNLNDSRLLNLADAANAVKNANRVILVLGEEVNGIPPALYPAIDFFAEIPMRGKKESFNVSVATGIALYELTR